MPPGSIQDMDMQMRTARQAYASRGGTGASTLAKTGSIQVSGGRVQATMAKPTEQPREQTKFSPEMMERMSSPPTLAEKVKEINEPTAVERQKQAQKMHSIFSELLNKK